MLEIVQNAGACVLQCLTALLAAAPVQGTFVLGVHLD